MDSKRVGARARARARVKEFKIVEFCLLRALLA